MSCDILKVNLTGVSRAPLVTLSPRTSGPVSVPTEELGTHSLLGSSIRNRAVGDFVVLNTAIRRGPVHLEAAGGLRVDEEVGGWAPGICGRMEGEQHKQQGEISVMEPAGFASSPISEHLRALLCI